MFTSLSACILFQTADGCVLILIEDVYFFASIQVFLVMYLDSALYLFNRIWFD